MGKRIAVMLRGSTRASLLNKVIRHFTSLDNDDHRIDISLLLDRPTAKVLDVVKVNQAQISQVLHCPFPIVSYSGGNRFMEAANFQYKSLGGFRPDFVFFADDDRIYEDTIVEELPWMLDHDNIDLWRTRSVFFWTPTEWRADMIYQHNSVTLFRYSPADVFPPDEERHIQAPARRHDMAEEFGRIGQMHTRLLDWGYASEEERLRLFHLFKRVGRLDGFVIPLLDENVKLEKYGGPLPFPEGHPLSEKKNGESEPDRD
jgi:hypothetical protein